MHQKLSSLGEKEEIKEVAPSPGNKRYEELSSLSPEVDAELGGVTPDIDAKAHFG